MTGALDELLQSITVITILGRTRLCTASLLLPGMRPSIGLSTPRRVVVTYSGQSLAQARPSEQQPQFQPPPKPQEARQIQQAADWRFRISPLVSAMVRRKSSMVLSASTGRILVISSWRLRRCNARRLTTFGDDIDSGIWRWSGHDGAESGNESEDRGD